MSSSIMIRGDTVDDETGGVIIWAWGRSATDQFAFTARETLRWDYCLGAKEGLKQDLSVNSLNRCVEKGTKITHVKPWMLTMDSSTLKTPAEFFEAALAANFSFVVAIFRENILHQTLSSFDLELARGRAKLPRNESAAQVFCKKNLKKNLEFIRSSWDEGVAVARRLGFKILTLSFNDVIRDTCSAVQGMLDMMYEPSSPRRNSPCRMFVSPHTSTSFRPSTIEGRVGSAAYSCILNELQDDPEYSWMLDPSLETPPSAELGIQPPSRA